MTREREKKMGKEEEEEGIQCMKERKEQSVETRTHGPQGNPKHVKDSKFGTQQ